MRVGTITTLSSDDKNFKKHVITDYDGENSFDPNKHRIDSHSGTGTNKNFEKKTEKEVKLLADYYFIIY